MKKITSFMLAFLLICSTPLFNSATVMAASPTYTNAQFYASQRVDTRTVLSGSNNGWIDAGDDCKIVSVGHMQGGVEYWCINYPISGGRKNAYALKSAFVTVSPYEVTVSQNTTVYRTSSMSTTYGTAYKTDQIFVLAESGSNVWIIYPLDAGGYKIGWTKSTNVTKGSGTTDNTGPGGSGTIRVTNLSVNSEDIRLGFGQTFQWNAIISPANASNKKVTFSSKNPSVATIDQNGLITAKSTSGQAHLIVVSDDSGLQKSAVVTVSRATIMSMAVGVNPLSGDENTGFTFAAITSMPVKSVKLRVNNVGTNNSEYALQPVDSSNKAWRAGYRFPGWQGVIPVTVNAYDAFGKVVAAQQVNITITPSSSGLFRPISGYDAGYPGDSGLDINARIGTTVHAIADGTIEYSQWGKVDSRWLNPPNTAYSVNIKLDNPIEVNGVTYRYVYYTHMSSLVHSKQDGSSTVIRVKRGDPIGESGIANNSPHLHFTLYDSRGNNQRYLSMEGTRELFGSKKGQEWVAGK